MRKLPTRNFFARNYETIYPGEEEFSENDGSFILIASRIPPAPISYSRIHSQGYRRSGPRVDHHVSLKLKLLSRETATNGSVEAHWNEPHGKVKPGGSRSAPAASPEGSRRVPGRLPEGSRRAPGGLEAQKTNIKNNVCLFK